MAQKYGDSLKTAMGIDPALLDDLVEGVALEKAHRPSDVGRILRTFKIKKNVEVTDNGKIII